MKIKILKPEIIVTKERSDYERYLLIVKNVTILTAYWFYYWYRPYAHYTMKITALNLNNSIIGIKNFYTPVGIKSKSDKIKYIKAIVKIFKIAQSMDLNPNFSFGMLPMSTQIDFIVSVEPWILTKNPENMELGFAERNDRWEFPSLDFGLFQEALNKARARLRKNGLDIPAPKPTLKKGKNSKPV